MPRSCELFTPAMYEQNLAAIAAISKLNAFTDTDYAELATLDDEMWRIQNISDYDYTQSTHEVFYEKIFQRQITYGKALQRAEDQIKKFGNLKYYHWFRFNHKYPRYSSIHTEPDDCNTQKYTCCVCNHFTYGNEYHKPHFAAYFYNRTKDVVEDCYIMERNGKFKSELDKETDECLEDKCCHIRCNKDGYTIIHCNLKHCKCFTRQSPENKKMLTGGYGSNIADDCTYFYCGLEETFKDGGVVCDWCLNDMIYKDELIYFH